MALLGGQVDALFGQPGDVRNLDAGNFKPILTVFNERPGAFSDVPTHKERVWILSLFCVSAGLCA